MAKAFHFKQFKIEHDRCAMKVGTDGVLLGAWSTHNSSLKSPKVLDVGSGSGVIALIAAQHYPRSKITAVEIESRAAGQASENFAASPWADRLEMKCTSIQDFSANSGKDEYCYDQIICNPPFFDDQAHYSANGVERQMARSDLHLTLDELFYHCSALLCITGVFSLILPFSSSKRLDDLAATNGLKENRKTTVYPIEGKPAHRLLVEFNKSGFEFENKASVSALTIQKSQVRNDFTAEYIELVRNLYTIL